MEQVSHSMNNAPCLNGKGGMHTNVVSVTLDGQGTSVGVVTRPRVEQRHIGLRRVTVTRTRKSEKHIQSRFLSCILSVDTQILCNIKIMQYWIQHVLHEINGLMLTTN